MKNEKTELLKGTLDLLILKTISYEPMNGWGISKRIEQISGKTFCVKQGSLYPCLHRLEAKGWISSKWGASEKNRKAKFYKLTKHGQKQLDKETESWRHFTGTVELILKMC